MSAGASGRPRRAYLDWLRGIAVLLMIEAHILDSWTRDPDRQTDAFRNAIIIGGMGTALFLLLAGVAAVLSAGSKYRRSGDVSAASIAVAKRGLQIFGLAFLFRLQAWILGWSSNPGDLLKVDILNIMGPSIVFAALIWRVASSVRDRAIFFATATVVATFLTPLLRAASLETLPDPLEAYIVPVEGFSNLTFFPWVGLVFTGGCIGVLIDATRTPEAERQVNLFIGVGGAALTVLAYGASFLPSPFEHSDFWTTSPAYFFIRAGIAALGVSFAYAWSTVFSTSGGWSPIGQLGRTSLFIYWIHVEMLYGLISIRLHHALSLRAVCFAYVMFTGFMLGCSVTKERTVEWYRLRRERAQAPA